jgi:hypothetical protein
VRIISEQELKVILDKHGKWLRKEPDGEKANLRSADLRSADLRWADLRSANLRWADLSSADLLVFKFQQHWAYFTFDGALRIGCIVMPISEWEIGFKEIGKENNYSDLQIEMYGDFIKSTADKFKRGLFEVSK